jgi:hypothetical protein
VLVWVQGGAEAMGDNQGIEKVLKKLAQLLTTKVGEEQHLQATQLFLTLSQCRT